jgi:L-ribulose-5-phosphate 3-epimerase
MTTAYRLDSPAVTRRTFLGCTAALALGAGSPLTARAATGPPLACRLASYGAFADTAWTHLPELGIHHIFLNVPAPDEVSALLDRLHQHELTVQVMRGSADLSTESSVDELAVQLATCRRMGAGFMFLSPKHGDAPREVAWERLHTVGAAAAAQNVVVTLETHPDLGTNGDVHLETMKAIDHPNIRVNFDTGNITFYNRGASAVDELRKIIDYVATVEFKDHNGEFETWVFPPLGKGIVDLPGVINVLKEHQYQGPVTLEFEGEKGVELDETGTKTAIKACVDYVRSLGEFS